MIEHPPAAHAKPFSPLWMRILVPLLATMLLGFAVSGANGAGQPTVNMGTASTYAVIAGSTITNTGPTTMSGTAGSDIGLSPGTAFTGSGSVTTSGSTHLADAAALQANADLVTAYQDFTARPITATVGTERVPH